MLAGQMPPGWYRNFIFMTWPAFKNKQWDYLKKVHAPLLHPPSGPTVFASDKDASMCGGLEAVAKQFGLSGTLRVSHKDFFDLMPAEATRRPGLVVLNPPFGIRMASDSTTTDYYIEIIKKLTRDFPEWRLALLVPETFSKNNLINKNDLILY